MSWWDHECGGLGGRRVFALALNPYDFLIQPSGVTVIIDTMSWTPRSYSWASTARPSPPSTCGKHRDPAPRHPPPSRAEAAPRPHAPPLGCRCPLCPAPSLLHHMTIHHITTSQGLRQPDRRLDLGRGPALHGPHLPRLAVSIAIPRHGTRHPRRPPVPTPCLKTNMNLQIMPPLSPNAPTSPPIPLRSSLISL